MWPLPLAVAGPGTRARRTTGVLRLRCEAAPFEEHDGGFRLKLRCDKWSHEVSVRRV